MTETKNPEQTGETSFWPLWVVFLLGSPAAALNWWRMGKKAKAVFFLFLRYLLTCLFVWVGFHDTITVTDHAFAPKIILAEYSMRFAFVAVLCILMAADIKQFKSGGQAPLPVKWQFIFLFAALPIAAQFGTWALLDHVAADAGDCRFPRLQDLIYREELGNRSGLETLVLGRQDFGCEWLWDIETPESTAKSNATVLLVGYFHGDRDTLLYVSERVIDYGEYTEENFLEQANNGFDHSGEEFNIEIDDPSARYSQIQCFRADETDCDLALGYRRLIVTMRLTFGGLSEDQVNALIQRIVATTSTRVHSYELGLP